MSSKDEDEDSMMMPVFESSRNRRLGFLRERSDSAEMLSRSARSIAMTGRSQSETKLIIRRRRDFGETGSSYLGKQAEEALLPSPIKLVRGGVKSAPPTITPKKSRTTKIDYVVENVLAPQLPAEVEKGNMEYKLQLLDVTNERLKHLVTQLQWRLVEGYNEAIYQIGVTDDGFPVGLTKQDLDESLETLKNMASRLNATTNILHVRIGTKSKNHYVAEVLIRQVSSTNTLLEIRVAVIGGVASGKSTLIGVLTKGVLDNGFGGARMTMYVCVCVFPLFSLYFSFQQYPPTSTPTYTHPNPDYDTNTNLRTVGELLQFHITSWDLIQPDQSQTTLI